MLGDLLRERDELKAAQQQNIELMELFPMHLTKDCRDCQKDAGGKCQALLHAIVSRIHVIRSETQLTDMQEKINTMTGDDGNG